MNVKPHLDKMVVPCWRSLEPMGELKTHSFSEIWTGEKANRLREQFLNGEKPKGCKRCWSVEENEDSKSISLRNRYNKKYSHFLPEVIESLQDDKPLPLKSAEIRFSSVCNFRCLHCHPSNSTLWNKLWQTNAEVQRLVYADADHLPKKIVSEEQINEFISLYAESMEEFWVCGGEPLIEPLHYYFLDQFPERAAKKIDLIVCTNFSKLSIPNYDLAHLWSKFKSVDVRIGIDGDEKTYEYFRYGGNFSTLKNNILEARSWGIDSIKISAVCTVNILNISRLRQINRFSKEMDVKFHYTFLNGHPNYLDVRNLPPQWKQQYDAEIGEILKDDSLADGARDSLKNVVTFMHSRQDDPQQIIKLNEYVRVMDKASKYDFKSYFSELEGLIDFNFPNVVQP